MLFRFIVPRLFPYNFQTNSSTSKINLHCGNVHFIITMQEVDAQAWPLNTAYTQQRAGQQLIVNSLLLLLLQYTRAPAMFPVKWQDKKTNTVHIKWRISTTYFMNITWIMSTMQGNRTTWRADNGLGIWVNCAASVWAVHVSCYNANAFTDVRRSLYPMWAFTASTE